MQTSSVELLRNGSATSAAMQWPGGRGAFQVAATFGGGSVALEMLAPDGVTFVPVTNPQGAAISLTAASYSLFELPPCRIRATVTTATGVYALASRVPI